MSEHPAADGAPARPPSPDADDKARHAAYWRRNIRYVSVLLAIWFLVSYGFGILLAEPLNELTVPGTAFPVGFWFAQQGSIYVFVALIFIYVWLMNRLDRRFDVDEGPVPGRRGRGRSAGRHAAPGQGGGAADRGGEG